MPSRDIVERRIPLRLCTTVTPKGETMMPYVRCPRGDESIDAHACAGCMRVRSLEWEPATGGEVRCLIGSEPTDPRADFGELAARTFVHEIASPLATFVTADVSLERVRTIFAESRARALAVVDAEGKLEALVSRTDLVDAPTEGTVRDVMTACVHALPEDAPIAYAVTLLAFEDIGEVPIVKMDGTVTGMCHALDVLRWVAGRLGYTAPTK